MKNSHSRFYNIRILVCHLIMLGGFSLDCTKSLAEDVGTDLGIGPVKKVDLKDVDSTLATHGKDIFTSKCSACHKIGEKYVGPDLAGVTKRRTPEWIMNMILNPLEMTQKDPIAKELFGEILIQMTAQNVIESDARAILEYLRQSDLK